jgi:hypothetical protein
MGVFHEDDAANGRCPITNRSVVPPRELSAEADTKIALAAKSADAELGKARNVRNRTRGVIMGPSL